jgi:glucuronate isomerase
VRDLPIVSPHGHTDPRWYAENAPFPDPARLFVTPDHYIFRMLYSQGVTLEEMGIPRKDGHAVETDARKIWRTFAERYYLFRGTPTRLWLDQSFNELFGLEVRPVGQDRRPLFRPHLGMPRQAGIPAARAVREFKIEVIATTESPLDPLEQPQGDRRIRLEGPRRHRPIGPIRWSIRSSTASGANLQKFGDITRCDTFSWHGYLEAHRLRRAFFKQHGATSTDHGHLTAQTVDLAQADAERLFAKVTGGEFHRGRRRAVPRADADRDGAHEPRRRAGDADPSGLAAQPQSGLHAQVRPRHGRRHPDPHRLCAAR